MRPAPLVIGVLLAIPGRGAGANAPARAGVLSPQQRVAAEHRRAELAALEALVETERGRPSGAAIRPVIDGGRHRLVVFVIPASGGEAQRARSFEPGFAVATLYALVLDADHRLRLLLVQGKDRSEGYEIDQTLFARDGTTAALDQLSGAFSGCADGRLHERRVVTVFGQGLQVWERRVEFPNDPASLGDRLAEGCSLGEERPPPPDAPSSLRALRLEQIAREAGVRAGRAAEVGGSPAQ